MSGGVLRSITSDELASYQNAITRTFMGSDSRPEAIEALRESLEFERTLAVFEADRIVATAGAFSFQMTTVGHRLPAAGVTRVTVRPTHRRQGLLSRMMRHQLDDIHARGEPLAILFASEAPIYGRFGYGPTTYAADFSISRGQPFRRPVEVGGRVRLVEKGEAMAAIPQLVERVALFQPGLINREPAWWRARFEDDPVLRRAAGDANFAVCDLGGAVTGYAIYRVTMDWTGGPPTSTTDLVDLIAADPESYAVLWRYLLDLDLMTNLVAHNRPISEPLRHLLVDGRAPRLSPSDGLWLRLVDLPAALSGRRYAVAGRLRLEVRDEFCPWNQGVHELDGGPDGARAGRTEGAPDLVLDTSDLAAAYLGSNSFRELAWAGRVEERVEGALARADAMFASPVPAWCPFHF